MHFTLAEIDRGTKINDFDLIVILVLLQEDVFWLEVPVHDFIAVTVMNALEKCLHKYGCVTLRELLSRSYLLKKLTTAA